MDDNDIADCPKCWLGFLIQIDMWGDEDVAWLWECDRCGAQFSYHPKDKDEPV